jgi:hypothetical protein
LNDGPDIQRKPAASTGLAGFAFEAGGVVPIAEPEIYGDEPPQESPPRRLDAAQLLDTILDGARSNDEIAANVIILAMLLKRPTAPATMSQFAARLDVSRTTGRRIWTAIFQSLQAKLKVFGH